MIDVIIGEPPLILSDILHVYWRFEFPHARWSQTLGFMQEPLINTFNPQLNLYSAELFFV